MAAATCQKFLCFLLLCVCLVRVHPCKRTQTRTPFTYAYSHTHIRARTRLHGHTLSHHACSFFSLCVLFLSSFYPPFLLVVIGDIGYPYQSSYEQFLLTQAGVVCGVSSSSSSLSPSSILWIAPAVAFSHLLFFSNSFTSPTHSLLRSLQIALNV